MKNRRNTFSASLRTVGYVLPLAAVMVLGVTGSAYGQGSRDDTSAGLDDRTLDHAVPAALVPPSGNVLSAVFSARGVQVYQCTAGAWVFVEPAASLRGRVRGDSRGARTVIHFRGPSWESVEDGSLVEAKAVAADPVTGSIPQLLLRASRNRGTGAFGRVTYVQRLATSGGAAPAGACTEGATTGVAYRAVYRFFVPAT